MNISVQPSFQDVIEDIKELRETKGSFWINFTQLEQLDDGITDEQVIHVSKVEGDDGVKFESDNLRFIQTEPGDYNVEYKGYEFVLETARRVCGTGLENATSFHISPDETRYLIGDDGGSLMLGSLADGCQKKTIKSAHYSTITRSCFFPSGEVALTTGLDLQIKIWNLQDGSSPRVFKSQKSRITDLVMVERGRNFLSSSLDGTINLWDCASGMCISTFKRSRTVSDGVTALCIAKGESKLQHTKSSYEHGTLGKTLIAGHNSGTVTLFDLGSREEMLNVGGFQSAVVDVLKPSEFNVLISYENGKVKSWDLRNIGTHTNEVDLKNTINSTVIDDESIVVSYATGYLSRLSHTLGSISTIVGTEDNVTLLASQGTTYLCSSSSIYKL